MRKRLFLSLLLICMLLSACGEKSSKRSGYVLYFLSGSMTSSATAHGPALDWEPYTGESQPEARDLLTALLTGPSQEYLSSPFPKGVTVRSCTVEEDRPDILNITLSEQYGALTGVSLTLADYCIVLTLSQIEGVNGVQIQSGGYTANYRNHQLLKADEVILRDVLVD